MTLCHDERWLDSADLSDANVWVLAVDDCDFQRLILEQICHSQLGVPAGRVLILGEEPDHIEHLEEQIVALMREAPPDARVLAIVDENLDMDAPLAATVSGSLAIEQARKRLEPHEEARLLALVRSANDGTDDVKLFTQRAHGFLTKCPTEPDRHMIMREWSLRFGLGSFARK